MLQHHHWSYRTHLNPALWQSLYFFLQNGRRYACHTEMYTPIRQAWKTKRIPKHSLTSKEFSWIYIIILLLSTRPWCVRVHIVSSPPPPPPAICPRAPKTRAPRVCCFFDPSRRYRFHRRRDEEQRITRRYYLLHTCVWPSTAEEWRRQNAFTPPRARIIILPTPHTPLIVASVGRSCVYIICLLYYCRHYNMCIVSLADCRVRVPTIVKRMDLVVYIIYRKDSSAAASHYARGVGYAYIAHEME